LETAVALTAAKAAWGAQLSENQKPELKYFYAFCFGNAGQSSVSFFDVRRKPQVLFK